MGHYKLVRRVLLHCSKTRLKGPPGLLDNKEEKHMTRNLPLLRAALCAGMLSASGIAAAWQDGAMGVYGAYGRTLHEGGSTRAPSAGVIIPWQGWTPWTPGPGRWSPPPASR